MADAIPQDVEFVTEQEFAAFLAETLREYLPGGIYIESGDDPSEVFVISRGERSAGIFAIKVSAAELRVNCGD